MENLNSFWIDVSSSTPLEISICEKLYRLTPKIGKIDNYLHNSLLRMRGAEICKVFMGNKHQEYTKTTPVYLMSPYTVRNHDVGFPERVLGLVCWSTGEN